MLHQGTHEEVCEVLEGRQYLCQFKRPPAPSLPRLCQPRRALILPCSRTQAHSFGFYAALRAMRVRSSSLSSFHHLKSGIFLEVFMSGFRDLVYL